jgi:hypothetical protein
MRIYQASYGYVVKALAIYAVFFGFLAIMEWFGLSSDSRPTAIGLLVFIAAGYLFIAIKMITLPEKCWVKFTADHIIWRTPKNPRRTVTPSGSVPLNGVRGFDTVPQQFEARKGRFLNGEAARLLLADGATVTLPIWCSALRRTQTFESLLRQLRLVTTETSARPS